MFQLPFTRDQFFGVFAAYNEAVWPAPILLIILALAGIALTFRGSRGADRWIAGLLAMLWAWSGLAYHIGFFAAVNRAAWIFGFLFLIQAILFVRYGVFRDELPFRPARDLHGVTGAVLLVYALVLYPLLGRFAGHSFPAAPTFGVPCPMVIYSFGMLLLARGRVPGLLLAVPLAWGVLGSSAVFAFGVVQDGGLMVAAVLGTALLVRRNRDTGRMRRRTAAAAAGRPGRAAAAGRPGA